MGPRLGGDASGDAGGRKLEFGKSGKGSDTSAQVAVLLSIAAATAATFSLIWRPSLKSAQDAYVPNPKPQTLSPEAQSQTQALAPALRQLTGLRVLTLHFNELGAAGKEAADSARTGSVRQSRGGFIGLQSTGLKGFEGGSEGLQGFGGVVFFLGSSG